MIENRRALVPRLYMSDADRADDSYPSTPRQRVSLNRASPVPLTGDWQSIPFAPSSSVFDVNSFPGPRYDFADQRILVNPDTTYEQAYTISLDLGLTINAVNTFIKLSVRFVVPRPVSDGGPIVYPLPDTLGRVDLPDQLLPPDGAVHFDYPVYGNSVTRQYGAQLQLRASSYRLNGGLVGNSVGTVTSALSGTQRPILTDAVMNMYAI